MAIMNKQSVREEFDRIKSEFNQVSKKQKVTPEIKALFTAMMLLVEVILAIFLEKQTKKTKDNSSKPSSQTEKDETSIDPKGSKGKGKPEENHLAANTRTVETTLLIPVDYCDQCGESLKNTSCQGMERRTKIDIIFDKNGRTC